MFDSIGTYLCCCSCIHSALGVLKSQIARLRAVNRRQSQDPILKSTKTEVEDQRFGDYVLMPTGLDIFWWRSVAPSTTVDVRYPHGQHGSAGKTSLSKIQNHDIIS